MLDVPVTDEPAQDGLRLARVRDPVRALGLAVSHLMAKPAYARMDFGAWSRTLAGQINRDHYCFVVDATGKVRGLLGWGYADERAARQWASGTLRNAGDGMSGDCVVFNVWSSDTPGANEVLLDAARHAMTGKREVHFRRFYADGRVRPARLSVNRFVSNHIARRHAVTSPVTG